MRGTGDCQGGAALWIGWHGGGRCKRPLSPCGGRCRSQVKVKRPRLPVRPCSLSGTLQLCSSWLKEFLLGARFPGRRWDSGFLLIPGKRSANKTPCRALRRGRLKGRRQQENSGPAADSGFLPGVLNRLTSVSRQLRVHTLLRREPRSGSGRSHFPLDFEGVCLGCPAAHRVFAVFLPQPRLFPRKGLS